MPRLPYQRIAFLILIIGCLIPFASRAQTIYNGQVLDKTSELPIPGVTVKFAKEQIATSTSAQGYFKLASEKEIPGDSLIFSSIGYKTYRLAIKDYQRGLLVALEQSATELKNVTITNRKVKYPTISLFYTGEIKYSPPNPTAPFTPGDLYAKYFKAKKNNARIVQIYLGLRQFIPQWGYTFGSPVLPSPNSRFKVHIITRDKATKQPGKTLFTKDIVLTEDILKLTIDLTQENWRIEDDEFFVAVEWLKIPYNESFRYGQSDVVGGTTKTGEQKLEPVALYTIQYRPALIMFNLTVIKRDVAFIKTYPGGWRKLAPMPEVAVGVALTY